MRVSTAMQYDMHLANLQRQNSKLNETSQQFNTGLKFQQAGEDPSGMSARIKYEGDIAAYGQYTVNAGFAAEALSEEETALNAMWEVLASVQTRIQQAVNGSQDQNSLDALAEDLKQSQSQLFDLMNTRNCEGEYIFSGSNSTIPTYSLTSDGNYACQADGSTRAMQVSPTMTVQTADSGLNVFEHVQVAHKVSYEDTPGNVASYYISNYGDFDDLYREYYDPGQSGSTQPLTIYAADGKFSLKSGGTVIDSGTVTSDGMIEVCGMHFALNDMSTATKITLTLKAPEKDNILNQLNTVIEKLRTAESLSSDEFYQYMQEGQRAVSYAKDHYDLYRGRVGARQNSVDRVIESNNMLSDIKTEARANVCEADAFEVASRMVQDQNALQAAQQTFQMVHRTTLFDYI